MRVLMLPDLEQAQQGESGINTVIRAYAKHLPAYGVELVPIGTDNFDVLAVHAGLALKHPLGVPTIGHVHGLYWSADYHSQTWEYKANANVIRNIRHADEVTVPSEWVAETFRRDMHRNPHVVRHGIDWDDWQHDNEPSDYVLWNKNRAGVDVCDSEAVVELARRFPRGRFITTFLRRDQAQALLPNVDILGVESRDHLQRLLSAGNQTLGCTVPHSQMKILIQHALVYLSTTKETFGIGALEAMASGVPVLGWDCGGNKITIQHGVNGYLVPTGDYDALAEGLAYCLKNRDVLGANGRELARAFGWESVAEQVAGIYRRAATREPATVAVVIPSFNYADRVGRAIASACAQTYPGLTAIVVVDDGSTEGDTRGAVAEWAERDSRVRYIYQDNAGVAHARNRGIAAVDTKYVACLDADDAMGPDFLTTCIPALEADRSLGIAYAGIWWHTPDGGEGASVWPGEFDYDGQLEYRNSVPTCCLFRRAMWAALGGYRQRYAGPGGAGAEDGEFWVRCGAAGWGAKKVAPSPAMVSLVDNLARALKRAPRREDLLQALAPDELEREKRAMFHYSQGSGRVSGNREYKQKPYLEWHPWVKDGLHPFASVATPRKFAHPVRQYDEPAVSVVIPVGPGHERTVIDALDSLDAQTFRKWEVVVAWDVGEAIPPDLLAAYPYVRWVETGGPRGAGCARNRGAEIARAPLLLYLDADDQFYHPEALELMVEGWHETGSAIYTDFLGAAYIADENIQRLDPKLQERVYESLDDGRRVIGHRQLDYDCERAQRQPEEPKPYIWCNITVLFPRAWHGEVGGFDEAMPSWEDVDYWWRMARLGKCFARLPQELFLYRFYSGTRRDAGAADYAQLIAYTKDKYKELPMARGCSGCGRQRSTPTIRTPRPAPRTVRELYSQRMAAQQAPPAVAGAPLVNDDDFIMCLYKHRSRGQQHTFGQYGWETRPAGVPTQLLADGLWHIHYGYRGGGDRFLVHRRDMEAAPHLYEPVRTDVAPAQPPAPPPPPPEPVPIVAVEEVEQDEPPPVPLKRDAVQPVLDKVKPLEVFNLAALPGITPALAEQMGADGVRSLDDVLALGAEGLARYKGIAERRAAAVLAYAKQEKERQAKLAKEKKNNAAN